MVLLVCGGLPDVASRRVQCRTASPWVLVCGLLPGTSGEVLALPWGVTFEGNIFGWMSHRDE